MLIQGTAGKNRTEILVSKYCSLLENGIQAEEILVLLPNSFKKNEFTKLFREKLKINHYENPQIYTFYGLCYNTVLNFWPYVENSLNSEKSVITPHLCGLEISRFLLGYAIKEADFKDYNSKTNLMHQLFRRHSLISNNNLTEKEVEQRSKVLKEVFNEDAQKALNAYKTKTIQHRAFDYLRQLNIFNYLYKNAECFKSVKYLILDDADEITPAEFEFLEYLKPQLREYFIAYDRQGTSRMGFLNADICTVKRIEKVFGAKEIINTDNVLYPNINIEQYSYTRRQEMIQKALAKVENLLNSGVLPEDIAIISPITDNSLKFAIKEACEQNAIKCQFITGSEKLSENILVKNCLTVLKLTLGIAVDVFEIRNLLSDILKIPLKYCMPVIEEYKNTKLLKPVDLGYDVYTDKLNELISVIQKSSNEISLSEKIYIFYENLLSTLQYGCIYTKEDYEKFMFFVKQIKNFEDIFAEQKMNKAFQKTVLNQISNSIISENPSEAPCIKENSIIVSTAQKITDFSHKTKYQIWLDTTSHEWKHDDFGTLYNAWVFQKSWDKDSFTNEDNIEYSRIKAEKVLRKLALLAEEKIFLYSSLYDTLGAENQDNINELLFKVCNKSNCDSSSVKNFSFIFTPREDQKPVLEYTGGKMAISAVPGAGKTTILLALIIKLLQNKIAGENIFVLTYMDSASKNFKDRIKTACPSLDKMPNISTIHGLALRILKENSNYVKAGLDENFDVCDDLQRQKILREVLIQYNTDIDDTDKYDKGISALKLSCIQNKIFTKDAELLKFLKIFDTYNNILKRKNLIDYEDMLVLSVKILEENPDIAMYYQDICQYIIEDEAQDSSAIQQKLLKILSAKHKNLIRCGDINQAITTTFTNTDLDGFKNFIKSSQNVLMTQSQRCTKDVYELANKLINYASKDDLYKNAFFPIQMQEVSGKNPIRANAVFSKIFEDYNDEKSFLLENIRKILAKDSNSSIAVLVRNNQQVQEFSNYFAGFGLNIVAGNDTLDKQPIFNLIFSLMKFCAHPWQNETVLEFAKVLQELKFLKFSDTDIDYIKKLNSPFILQDNDSIDSAPLVQLLWDLNYWLENSSLNNIEDFTIKAGMYYFRTEIEKSNIYPVSSFFKSIMSQYTTIDTFLSRIDEIKSRPVGQKYIFFENDRENEAEKGSIQIMTYHKSKGGEFDYVFIPCLNEEYLQFMPESIKIKSKERFLEAVKALNSKYKKKDENDLKLFQIEENFRLLYVAVTRAKKNLFVTTAKNCKKYNKSKQVEPSMFFEKILNKTGAKNGI